MMAGSLTTHRLLELPIMAYTRLSVIEREEISRSLAEDPLISWTALGRLLGRHRSTVQREVGRNGGRYHYRASEAHGRAQQLKPCRGHRLDDPDLAGQVRSHLEAGYSPAGTAHLLGGIVAETIYQGVYGGLLGLEARKVLRTRRHRRRPRNGRRAQTASHFLGAFTSIHDRPAEVEDRSEFGHWEGDLIIGARNQTALITLVERVTRTHVVLDLPDGHRSRPTCARLNEWVATTPSTELRSITWDRGSEMADWAWITAAWDLDFYFADARSPWQRGANENGNRQLRFWLPKGTDLAVHPQSHLDGICHVLNTQPRRSLHWQSPNQVYAAQTAH